MGIVGVRRAGSTRLASILQRVSSFQPEKGHRVRVATAISNRPTFPQPPDIRPDAGHSPYVASISPPRLPF